MICVSIEGEIEKNPERSEFEELIDDFSTFFDHNPEPTRNTLRNVFTMRIFGNKTHGDLAEVALTELISTHLNGYTAEHVGKEQFRSKSSEEDILVTNQDRGSTFPISLKAYGVGPLQLSTNKDRSMYELLLEELGESETKDQELISDVLTSDTYTKFEDINVLPLIYNEDEKKYNILVFDIDQGYSSVETIKYIDPDDSGNRKHPCYRFYGEDGQYILEVRYGGAGANALQRGMWTHIKNAEPFFNSVTNGWQNYSINMTLLDLFSKGLIETEELHETALELFEESSY